MLAYSDIKPKKIIELDGEPYQVLSSKVFRKQQRKPVNQTKLKHLVSGKTIDYTFHQSDKVEEADVQTREVQYLYTKKDRQTGGPDQWWFADPNDPSKRFMIAEDIIGERTAFLKENAVVTAIVFNDTIVDITLPIKIQLQVTQAPPNVRGNTTQGGTKQVTLETGAVVTTPMFIETGDVIEVNTESGTYVQRIT